MFVLAFLFVLGSSADAQTSESLTDSQRLEERYQQALNRYKRLAERTARRVSNFPTAIDEFRLTFESKANEHDLFKNPSSSDSASNSGQVLRFRNFSASRASHNPGDTFETSSLGKISQSAARGTATIMKSLYSRFLAPRAAQADDGEGVSGSGSQDTVRHRTLDELEMVVKEKKNYEIDALAHF